MSHQDPSDGPVWARFDWTAQRYENFIRRVVPDYSKQEPLTAELLRDSMPSGGVGPFRIMELGSGTGSLSSFLLRTFPGAELTALDVSPVMLDASMRVLAPFADRVHLIRADLGTVELGTGYHAVVSRLAVHHLKDEDKRALFRRLAGALLPGGVFVMSDLITGATSAETETMLAEWRRLMLAKGENPVEWESLLEGEDDHPSPARTQADWLIESGFAEVQIVWQRAQFAILRGIKPG